MAIFSEPNWFAPVATVAGVVELSCPVQEFAVKLEIVPGEESLST
jgi:hypothetical protein